jgi:hypothetical protein
MAVDWKVGAGARAVVAGG